MRVDAIAVELRPRAMAEATDLGVRLVQANARSVWRSCTPVFVGVMALALATIEIAPWLPLLVVFWLKPWLDRSVLFVLSRAVFGQATTFADLWQARRQVWAGQWLSTLLWRRFSPWRTVTQPIYQLEGQPRAARRARRRQLLSGQRGVASGAHLAFAHVEAALSIGAFAVLLWLAPQGSREHVLAWIGNDENLSAALWNAAAYFAVVGLLEPFYVGAGFAMYLNRRVQLEAWDIEQEFRRAF